MVERRDLGLVVVGLDLVVHQVLDLERVHVAADHQAQVVGDELEQVVVAQHLRVRGEDRALLRRLDVALDRHQPFLAHLAQDVVEKGHQFHVQRLVVPAALEARRQRGQRRLDRLGRIADDEGAGRRPADHQQFERLEQRGEVPAGEREAAEHRAQHRDVANGTLTFNAGTTSQNISVVVVNDGLNESNETVIVTLSNATIASLGTNTVHTFTIIDDDTPSITFDAATSSGSEATTTVNIPVTMAISATASVNYSVTGGTATGSGTDYTLAAGTLSWTAESGTKNIVVTINNDTLDELDETIVITLASPTSANLGAITAHTFTITDNDNAPTVAFGAATSGSTDETAANRTIAINLSAASGQAVSVVVTDLETGSATSGTDYTAIGSPLTVNFAAGETTKNVTIPVLADTTDENDETINFQLSSPSNATLGGQTTHAFSIISRCSCSIRCRIIYSNRFS